MKSHEMIGSDGRQQEPPYSGRWQRLPRLEALGEASLAKVAALLQAGSKGRQSTHRRRTMHRLRSQRARSYATPSRREQLVALCIDGRDGRPPHLHAHTS